MQRKRILTVIVAAVFSVVSIQASAFADDHGGKKSKWNPVGWVKGEKKGWKDGDVPPGLTDKDARKAEKEARKKAKKAEKEARKNARKAEKDADKKAEEVKAALS